MKNLFFLLASFFLLSFVLVKQNTFTKTTEILFVSADHFYPEDLPENFEEIIEEITAFNPTIFFTENVSPNDLEGLKYDRPDLFVLPSFFKTTKVEDIQLDCESAIDIRNNLALIKQSVFDRDVANFEYHTYGLFQDLNQLEKSERTIVDRQISTQLIAIDTLAKYAKINKRTEYNLIAFPAAKRLGLSSLASMDNQDNAQEFDLKWEECMDGYYNMINDCLSPFIGKVGDEFAKQGQYTKYMNTEFFDQKDFLTYAEPLAFSKHQAAAARYAEIWEQRNLNMVANIDRQLKAQAVDRAVVIVGSAHGRLMKKYLKEKSYQVRPIFDGELNPVLQPYLEEVEKIKKLFKTVL